MNGILVLVPTYQYRCAACGEQLDVKQSFSDAALTTCPECGGTLRKVFGAAGVVFKGSGFYRNDSRATSTNTASAPSASSGSSSGSSSSSSSDSSGSGAA